MGLRTWLGEDSRGSLPATLTWDLGQVVSPSLASVSPLTKQD